MAPTAAAAESLPRLGERIRRTLLAVGAAFTAVPALWLMAAHTSPPATTGQMQTLGVAIGLGVLSLLAVSAWAWRRIHRLTAPYERLSETGFSRLGTGSRTADLQTRESMLLDQRVGYLVQRLQSQDDELTDVRQRLGQLLANTARLSPLASWRGMPGDAGAAPSDDTEAPSIGRAPTAADAPLAVTEADWREPLQRVDDMMTLMLNTALTPHQLEHAIISRESVRRMLMLLGRSPSNPASTESVGSDDETQSIDLGELLESCVMHYARAAQQLGVELSCRIDAGCPSDARGDRLQLHRVICALLSAAITATGPRSLMVRMRASSGAGPRRWVSVSIRNSKWLVVPGAVGDEAAEPSQVSTLVKGLPASVASAIKAMGGLLKVSQSDDGGFAMRLEWPVTVPQAAAPEPHKLDWNSPWRVLVADDNAAAQIVLRHCLREVGMEVTTVNDGAQAWASMAMASRSDAPYDLVIASSKLPDIDGLGLARRIELDDVLRMNTRLVLTAPLDGLPASDSPDARMATWLPKPIRRSTLRTALSQMAAFSTEEPADSTRLRARIDAPDNGAEDSFDDSDWEREQVAAPAVR